MSVISGPVAPFNNPPINPQYYQPRQYFIENVALGQTTTITTTVDHDYEIGQQIRLLIPNGYGCTQLNEVQGTVVSIPAADQVVTDIYSAKADSFISASLSNQPQIIAIGDYNSGNISTTGRITNTNVIGSFINISPN